MADKVLKINATGGVEEYSPITVSTGASDSGKITATNSEGKIDSSLFPDGIGEDIKVLTASEALTAGNFVNIFSDSGTLKVRKADASQGFTKKAHGFIKDNCDSASTVKVYFSGSNTNLTGLTAGTEYLLSDSTPGGTIATAPSTSGYIAQSLGIAVSSTEILVNIGTPIKRV